MCLAEGLSREHHREGRVIALEYASFTVLVLYVPNNGTTVDSFRRRYIGAVCCFANHAYSLDHTTVYCSTVSHWYFVTVMTVPLSY